VKGISAPNRWTIPRAGQSEDWPLQGELGEGEGGAGGHAGGMLDVSGVQINPNGEELSTE
jgi:hypothetical protein